MIANNYLEIYTLMFGWNMYGAIWDILAGSGIALIPIIAAVVSNFLQNYESGDAKSAIRGIEMTILSMVIVMMLCVMPFRGFGISIASVEYNFNVPDCNLPVTAPNSGTGDNTGTAYDASLGASIGGIQIYKPIAWSFVEILSSAITHTTLKSMGCVNNYELMLMRVGQIEIIDPILRQRIRAFSEHCYKYATLRYQQNPPVPLPLNLGQVNKIDWIGSRELLGAADEYYRHEGAYMKDMDKFGFQRNVTSRVSDAAETSGANPYCNEVWSGETAPGVAKGLREILLTHINTHEDDKAGKILKDWVDWGSEVLTIGTAPVDVREDLLLKMVLQGNASGLTNTTEVSTSLDFEAKPGGPGLLANLFALGGIVTSVDEFLKANMMKQMIKTVGPMILALIQMVVIMSAVFVMIMGKYKFEAFVAIALTYFSFEFINVIWGATFWFDQQILDLYMSQAGGFDVATNTFIVKAVSAGATILLPSVWLSIMAYSGAGMVRGMGMGGVGGGQAAGSAVGQGKTRGLMNSSLNNWQKNRNKSK